MPLALGITLAICGLALSFLDAYWILLIILGAMIVIGDGLKRYIEEHPPQPCVRYPAPEAMDWTPEKVRPVWPMGQGLE